MDTMFTKVSPEAFSDVFSLLNDQWMLITAADGEKLNPMTASWGGLGVLWGRPVTYCVVRPQRHTHTLLQKTDKYTLSFYGEEHRKTLSYCGAHSGRDTDKAADTGLTPVTDGDGFGYFEQASWVLFVKKLYVQRLDPGCSVVPNLFDEFYPEKDYHHLYIGSVEKVYSKE